MDSHLCSGLSSDHLSRPPTEMVPFQHKVTGMTARSRRGEKLSDGTDVLATSLIPNTSLRSDSGCCVVLQHQLTSTQSEPNPDFIQFKEDNLFLKLLGTSQGQAVFQGCAVGADL